MGSSSSIVLTSGGLDSTTCLAIAKSDGSNHVRYDIHAKSITDIFRVANSAPNNP